MKIATNQERLIELFNADPRNDTAIASELNVSKQALSAWRKGTRSPKKTVLVEISKMYNVSLEWLMGFDVPKQATYPALDLNMFGADQPQTKEARIVSGGMDKLPQEQREQILNVLRAMFSNHPELFNGKDE